jgi:hypothetical protein
MTQVVEHLPGKHKPLSSNSSMGKILIIIINAIQPRAGV